MESNKNQILKTLCYADVFSYPLTTEELYNYLITSIKVTPVDFLFSLRQLEEERIIETKHDVIFLRAKAGLVKLREKRAQYSLQKQAIALKWSKWLQYIPTIQLIGITGGLAMNNAKKQDDIDFFIITKAGAVWITRFLTLLVAAFLGNRRKPGQIRVKDALCFNMFIDEAHMKVPQSEQDLFSAHEVVQMRPLFNRDNTYDRFLLENKWVKKFLGNFKIKSFSRSLLLDSCFLILSYALRFLEFPAKKFQLWYMRRRRTSEVVGDGYLRFHPRDARKWVMRAYKKRVAIYKQFVLYSRTNPLVVNIWPTKSWKKNKQCMSGEEILTSMVIINFLLQMRL